MTVRINSTTPTQSRKLRDCTKPPVIKSTTAMVAAMTDRISPAAASSWPQVEVAAAALLHGAPDVLDSEGAHPVHAVGRGASQQTCTRVVVVCSEGV